MRKSMLFVVVIAMALYACSSKNSTQPDPEFNLSGIVTAADGEVLANVEVTINAKLATTDANGRYAFSGVKSGTHSITAKLRFFFDFAAADVVVSSSSQTYNIVMQPQTNVVVSDSISGDTSWKLRHSPYFVNETLHVEAILTIEPGVSVLVAADKQIRVKAGKIIAKGTASDVIHFGAQNAGVLWRLLYGSAESEFEYCRFSDVHAFESNDAIIKYCRFTNLNQIKFGHTSRTAPAEYVTVEQLNQNLRIRKSLTRSHLDLAAGCEITVAGEFAQLLSGSNVMNGVIPASTTLVIDSCYVDSQVQMDSSVTSTNPSAVQLMGVGCGF